MVIDESLLDLESLQLAREMGYTGWRHEGLRRGQTQSLLLAAAAQHYGLFLCVQDLTCPGASLIHSAGLAAHVLGVAAIEANARQYVPAANASWRGVFPGSFRFTAMASWPQGVDRTGVGGSGVRWEGQPFALETPAADAISRIGNKGTQARLRSDCKRARRMDAVDRSRNCGLWPNPVLRSARQLIRVFGGASFLTPRQATRRCRTVYTAVRENRLAF